MKQSTRLLSLLMAMLMLVVFIPAGAFATAATALDCESIPGLNIEFDAYIENPGEAKYFEFVPERTATYHFYSKVSEDTYG